MYGNYHNDFDGNSGGNEFERQNNAQGIYGEYRMPQPTQAAPVKKKGKLFPKIAVACCLGLLFGLFAGAGFYAVNATATALSGNEGTKSVETVPTVPAVKTGTTDTEAVTVSAPVTAVVTDVTEVVKKVMPSVVSVTNLYTETTHFFGQQLESEGKASGSGIIVGESDTELLIVTNQHVISDAKTIDIQFIDGENVEAQVKGYDSDKDVAVIAVPLAEIKSSTKDSIAVATLGNSDELTVGEPAIAIGNALGIGQSVTTGVISAVNREFKGKSADNTLIQTDAAINPGNSGGALLNIKGEVIGINSNKIGGAVVEGMGYAIPISQAKPIIEDLMTKTTKVKAAEGEKAYLGISGVNVTEEVSQMYDMPKGVYIAQVYEETGAWKAGLVKGDIITKFDGSSVASMEELQKMMEYYEAGTEVELTIEQGSPAGYQEKKVMVTLGARKDAEQ